MQNDLLFEQALSEGLRPDPLITVSQWADQYRILPSETSSESGQWRTERTPYLRAIMDALSPMTSYKEIGFMKSSQVGGTEAGINWIDYIIDAAPGPTMAVQPTVETAKKWSKSRLQPSIDLCERLRRKIPSKKSKDPNNTAFYKLFPGGGLFITGANSAVGLRSQPIRFLFLDEIDGYPSDVDNEGDPVELAMARTRTFARRKIFLNSTPTIYGRSRIQAFFDKTDQRRWHVPCPHCGGMQHLEFNRLRWDEGDPESAQYWCIHCEALIPEYYKTEMLSAGEWVPDVPENISKNRIGFHINALYSPLGWYSWANVAEEFLRAKKDVRKLRVFVNTCLGEPFREKGIAPEWQRLYERREHYPVNRVTAGAALLTAGVDVQKDRLECEIVGWGPNLESWSIDYRVYPGNTATEEPWLAVECLFKEYWPHELGGKIALKYAAFDSSDQTAIVYRWVRKFGPKALAIKGRASLSTIIGQPSKAEINERGKRINAGIKLWPMGTDTAKSELYSFLGLDAPVDDEPYPIGYCHFPQYDSDYFKMLTAEELTTKKVRGYTRYSWEKIRDRNEALDCRNMARVAAQLAGVDRLNPQQWEELFNNLRQNPKVNDKQSHMPSSKAKRRGNEFWDRSNKDFW